MDAGKKEAKEKRIDAFFQIKTHIYFKRAENNVFTYLDFQTERRLFI